MPVYLHLILLINLGWNVTPVFFVSQAVDYEAFICCEDIICQLWSRMVWVSTMTPRHELWMDDEAIY